PLEFTVKFTVPLPLPLEPPVIPAQLTLLTAVHAQPDPAVTFTLPVPPAALKEALLADSEYVHWGGPPAAGAVATAMGYTPTCAMVFITTLVATDIVDREN